MELEIQDPNFKELFFKMINNHWAEDTNKFVNFLLKDLIERINNSEFLDYKLFLSKQTLEFLKYNEKFYKTSTWTHPINIPVEIRKELANLGKNGLIKYDRYDPHVKEIKSEARRNVTNALCHALIIESLNQDEGKSLSEVGIKLIKPDEGDVVELISGPFNGETAKITYVDSCRDELTIELFESVVPIPITVRPEQTRIIKKKNNFL